MSSPNLNYLSHPHFACVRECPQDFPKGIRCGYSSSGQDCWRQGSESAQSWAIEQAKGAFSGLSRTSNSGIQRLFKQHPSLFTYRTSFIISPLEVPYFKTLSFPYKVLWQLKISFSICTTFHLVLHSLNKYLLSSYCMPGIELSPSRWERKVWPLATRRVYILASKYASKWIP